MTQHMHSEYVEGCYRCDLGRDEACQHIDAEEAQGDWFGWFRCPDCGCHFRGGGDCG